MKAKEGSKIYKGMVFGGCSFTWGQGLYYYSGLPTLKESEPDAFDPSILTHCQIKYMESNRFPRLVSKKFKSYEFVYPGNGGSNEGVVKWWEACFYKERYHHGKMNGYEVPEISTKEVSHFIFQLTEWSRDHVIIENQPFPIDIQFSQVNELAYKDLFLNQISKDGLSLKDFTKMHIEKSFTRVKNFLLDLENDGIKTFILTWPDEYLNIIRKDPWASERLIGFEYNGKNYESIRHLMDDKDESGKYINPEMTIKHDIINFINPPQDHHPSILCHKLIADSIIKKIG